MSVMGNRNKQPAYNGTCDRDLLAAGREDELLARVLARVAPEVQNICSRLVGMGRCQNNCPDACPEFNSAGIDLAQREIRDAIDKKTFTADGFLRVYILDDDFRRLWNQSREIVPKVMNNKLLRGGNITSYGALLADVMATDPLLHRAGPTPAIRLKVAESWLRNIWDDACDNAEMDIGVHSGGSESTYRHPKRFLPDGIWSRYGTRVDRVHRRRLQGEHERSVDANLAPELRPSDTSLVSLGRTREMCDSLLRALEKAEETHETYTDAPTALTDIDDPRERLTPLAISSKLDDGYLQVSADDMDRFDDGVVDVKNPAILFDDFSDAWYKSRRPDGSREISIETPVSEGRYIKDLLESETQED